MTYSLKKKKFPHVDCDDISVSFLSFLFVMHTLRIYAYLCRECSRRLLPLRSRSQIGSGLGGLEYVRLLEPRAGGALIGGGGGGKKLCKQACKQKKLIYLINISIISEKINQFQNSCV